MTAENERRYKAYLETKTDQQAADKLDISLRAFRCWRQNCGMQKYKHRVDCSYVTGRPEWERARIKHFGSFLERLPAMPENVGSVIEFYRQE